jgi:hypothetical protein
LTNYFENSDVLVAVVESNVKTAIETKSENVIYQCQRISEGLKLAQSRIYRKIFKTQLFLALAGDKEANEKLRSVLTATLCAHINESQLVSNTAVVYQCSPPSTASLQRGEVPEWR